MAALTRGPQKFEHPLVSYYNEIDCAVSRRMSQLDTMYNKIERRLKHPPEMKHISFATTVQKNKGVPA